MVLWAAWWRRDGVSLPSQRGRNRPSPNELPIDDEPDQHLDANRSTADPISDSVRGRIADVQRTERALAAKLGRRPSTREIASDLDLDIDQVLEARAAAQPVGSLDDTVGSDGDQRHADTLADPSAPDPLETLCDDVPVIDLEERLGRLPGRSRRVIELGYGLEDGVPRTADSVADELGVARERVRQIELHTLRKLAADADPVARAA
jgi:DNA-directed RNA polymerase sigma subunit (sigma70/sigma32)